MQVQEKCISITVTFDVGPSALQTARLCQVALAQYVREGQALTEIAVQLVTHLASVQTAQPTSLRWYASVPHPLTQDDSPARWLDDHANEDCRQAKSMRSVGLPTRVFSGPRRGGDVEQG